MVVNISPVSSPLHPIQGDFSMIDTSKIAPEIFWHFTSDTLRDGSPIPPIGEWLIFPGEPAICERGLHSSRHPMDALIFAPGKWLHKVEMYGITEEDPDKVVGKGRKILSTIDSLDVLRQCARKYASDVLHLWNPPEFVVEYLKTGNESLRGLAWAAARAAAWGATRAAAMAAAWAATRDSSWAATRDSSMAAARAAARAAAWAATRDSTWL